MKQHLNRVRKCKIDQNGIELTEEIIDAVLSKSYKHTVVPPQEAPIPISQPTNVITHNHNHNNNSINATFQIINIGENIFTNRDLSEAIKPFIKFEQHGHGNVFYDRLQEYAGVDIDQSDVRTMVKSVTETTDKITLKDAYYAYNPVSKSCLIRVDDGENTWHWQSIELKDIFTNIVEQIQDNVLYDYEVVLNEEFMRDGGDISKLKDFYKIMKYCLLKPLCVRARGDNQLIYTPSEPAYKEPSPIFDMAEKLNDIYNNTPVDPYEMMQFRDDIDSFIQTNGTTTFKMVQEFFRSIIGGDVGVRPISMPPCRRE